MASDRLSLLLYRALLLAIAAAALGSGIVAGLDAHTITPEYQLTEYWRAYGLLVFAALAAYLAATPPGAAVLWLVVIFHKASMTMTAVLLLKHDVAGAPAAAAIDGAMVLGTVLALALRSPAARAQQAARAEAQQARRADARPESDQSRRADALRVAGAADTRAGRAELTAPARPRLRPIA